MSARQGAQSSASEHELRVAAPFGISSAHSPGSRCWELSFWRRGVELVDGGGRAILLLLIMGSGVGAVQLGCESRLGTIPLSPDTCSPGL